jgi:streptogramin lyase
MKIVPMSAVALLAGLVACGGSRSGDGGTPPTPPALTVFAGTPSGVGFLDGTGAAARFFLPQGVAVDRSGNVYVADSNGHTIRKITPAGVVTTLAGTAGSSGSADGTGAAARFVHPSGVAVDGGGSVYVADFGDDTVRKITPTGVVTTLAGTAGTWGSLDGTGSAARFYNPNGVAVDGSGNVYVADYWNSTIRKVTPTGVVTTLAGTAGSTGSADGTGAAAQFSFPIGVAVDGAGNVYVADSNNYTIRKVTPAGVVTTLAGTAGLRGGADGTGPAARFNQTSGVSVDGSGNVYVADSGNNLVRKITPTGEVTTLAGMPGSAGTADGTGTVARFNWPEGVAVDGTGDVYVADTGNNTIRKVTPSGVVTTLAGTAGLLGSADGTGAAAQFTHPEGVAVDGSGNVFVADAYNSTIRKITPTGVVTTLAGTAGLSGSADGTGAAARFFLPQGVAVDGSGNVYVADSNSQAIRKITPAGVVRTLAGMAGVIGSADATGAAALFNGPQGVAVDGAGNVYVADTGNSTIRKITPAGVVTTLAGTAGPSGSADGTGAAAQFALPRGVAVDGTGNVLVADSNNHAIRKITPAGVVTTLAGMAGVIGSADGTGAAARFSFPQGIAVDGAGNVYVADVAGHTIRKITPAGVVSTPVGLPGLSGTVAGPLPASLYQPTSVAVDPATGELFITVPDAVLKVTF